jgi:2'-5' RNA ligase
MRTFIAIPLPKETKDLLSGLQNQLKSCGADVKWVQPQNIHLTLKFLGEINEEELNKISLILEEIANKISVLTVSIDSIGAFPRINSPRIIWTGLGQGDNEIKILAKELEERLNEIGIPKEEKPFSSHITLGRMRSGLKIDKLISGLKELTLPQQTQGRKFPVQKIALFKSTLTPKGPVYEILKEANLKTD